MHGPIVAVVLSAGDAGAALETARAARRCSHHARIVEPDAGVAAAIRCLAGPDEDVGVVAAAWRAHPDPAALAGDDAAWALVLAAGEEVVVRSTARLLGTLARDPRTPHGVELRGLGHQLRLLPVERRPAPEPPHPARAIRGRATATLRPACPVCGSDTGFSPLPPCFIDDPAAAGFAHPIDGWEFLNVDAYACRGCAASDRDRLIWLYLDAHLPPGDGVRLLEIAPSPVLGPRLRRRLGAGYRSGDLFMAGVDDRVDLEAMPYEDASFDWLLCSHVLEHVADDVRAMREIRRVLRPDGRAVLLVPISRVATAIDEEPTLACPKARLARFGQDDHVRLYHREGFVGRLRRAGLRVEIVSASDVGAEVPARHAIPASAALYVVRP